MLCAELMMSAWREQVIFGETATMQSKEGGEMTHAFLSALYQGWCVGRETKK